MTLMFICHISYINMYEIIKMCTTCGDLIMECYMLQRDVPGPSPEYMYRAVYVSRHEALR